MEEVIDAILVRIPKRQGTAPFDVRPRVEDFLPSTKEREGACGDKPVLISVFDDNKTTFHQCLTIRGIAVHEGFAAFQLEAKSIRNIPTGDGRKLFVVYDPLPEPACRLEGADGHCGIGDLARHPGQPKAVVRDICSRLVDLAQPYGFFKAALK